jgi:hypothetical protein
MQCSETYTRTCQVALLDCQLVLIRSGLDWALLGSAMNSKSQFAALELMCRERAALAKKEMEYWLTEAEEWKELRNSPEPFDERIANRSNDLAESNNA